MKRWMLRLAAAFSMALAVGLGVSPARAQGQGQPSPAEMQEMQAFQTKAAAIQKKYMPQLEAITKKYKPQLDAIEKKYGLAKYKAEQMAIQTEARALKPEDQQGAKGLALKKRFDTLQAKAKSDPNLKKAESEAKPIQKKMFTELQPVAKKVGAEILAAAPAKLKPMVQQQLAQQMKMMGG